MFAIVLANIHQLDFEEKLKNQLEKNNKQDENRGGMSVIKEQEKMMNEPVVQSSQEYDESSDNNSGSNTQDNAEVPFVQNAQQPDDDNDDQENEPPKEEQLANAQEVALSAAPEVQVTQHAVTRNAAPVAQRRIEPSASATESSMTRTARIGINQVPEPPKSLLPLAAGTWLMYIRLQWPYLARAYDVYALWVTMIKVENIEELDSQVAFQKASALQNVVERNPATFSTFLEIVRRYGVRAEDERLRLIPQPRAGFYMGVFVVPERSWTMSDVFERIVMNNTTQARTFVDLCEYGNLLFGWRMQNMHFIKPPPMEMFVFFARDAGCYPMWMQDLMNTVMRGDRKRGRDYHGEQTEEPEMHRAIREDSEEIEDDVDDEENYDVSDDGEEYDESSQ